MKNIFIISHPEFQEREENLINAILEIPEIVFHLRKPGLPEQETRDILRKINPGFLPRVALHFHQEVLSPEFDLVRVHFPVEKRKITGKVDLELMAERGLIRSTSVHFDAEIPACAADYDFVFYGPVWNSISKPGYYGKIPDVNHFDMSVRKKLVGIGGVVPEKFELLAELGFLNAGISGWIWSEPEKIEAKKKILVSSWHKHGLLS